MGRDDIVQELSISKLVAHCIGYNHGITRELLSEMFRIVRLKKQSAIRATMQLLWSLSLGQALRYGRGAWRRVLRVGGIWHSRVIVGLPDMVAVSKALEAHLAEQGSSFARYAREAGESWRLS
jgi:hypothetical protein